MKPNKSSTIPKCQPTWHALKMENEEDHMTPFLILKVFSVDTSHQREGFMKKPEIIVDHRLM
ncbi:MAG: hypothetical protein A2Z14_09040 [Chloroflexi bacterium RBG_16_48_8]|nr:MAG: hypothetical protein A2Z14_09040 [Chloroflexi bacterium RBG_16_48_8]